MHFSFVRALRTLTSERFLLQTESLQDQAVLDVHYLADGNVIGTLVILDSSLLVQQTLQALMQSIDEHLFPVVSLDEKNLSFTVLQGTLIGQVENEKQG